MMKLNKLVNSVFDETAREQWNDPQFQARVKRILKPKPAKDETTIKRPLSPYIRFCQDEREDCKKHNPGMTTKEITSLLGEKWNDLKKNNPEILKQRYNFEVKN
ncbi:hypothetical protein AV955_gp022 [Diadromus pulchellus ascovirus 4a]|uniref:Complete DpAV4 genome n=1 Tax=Diadromus pulchellus ascovirus 4a TaxID=158683 RepID=F2NYV1_9VIRU|nr:hypothetical protein AV955_gp022 [Diadromus pulchellus ascovirus 4a]CCA61379.1 unnamed protein product [Diadromus pulchellus ascovirus 4a]